MTTGDCERTLEGHSYVVSSLCVLSDGRLASGSEDKTIRIWNVIDWVGEAASADVVLALNKSVSMPILHAKTLSAIHCDLPVNRGLVCDGGRVFAFVTSNIVHICIKHGIHD